MEPNPRSSGDAGGVARLAPGLVATLFLLLWAALVSLRVAYPFELEWMEGGMLDHIERVRSGKPLYTPPSLEFGSYPYTPLFPWVGAIFAEVLGPGFVSARLVSILSGRPSRRRRAGSTRFPNFRTRLAPQARLDLYPRRF